MGPSFNKDKKYRYYKKGFEGDLDNANAVTAVKAGFAIESVKTTSKVGAETVETTSKKPRSEKR